MITDSVVYIDDCRFAEAQMQYGDQLYLVALSGRDVIVFDVSEETFLALQRDPSADAIAHILKTHHWEYVR